MPPDAMKIWIDVDNPPQVQYLTPFREVFGRRGAGVVVTARDYGTTLEMLAARRVPHHAVDRAFGASKARKVVGLVRRAHALRGVVGNPAPTALLAASRPAAVAARSFGTPSFIVGDYEFANVSVYRWTRSFLLHPEVVDPEIFVRRGLRPWQLIAFRGLKEDVSFRGVDLDAVPAAVLPETRDPALVRVLFRPPAEASHYYDPRSRELALQALRHVAERDDAVLLFSPRAESQVADLEGLPWSNEPVVLRRPIPFVSLLKSVDLVLCSGGTMLREAAYLGVPAYSLLRSEIGGVDLHLERLGRVRFVTAADELDAIELRKSRGLDVLRSNPELADEIADVVLERAAGAAPLGRAA
jgi:predicted glycosyltransferase